MVQLQRQMLLAFGRKRINASCCFWGWSLLKRVNYRDNRFFYPQLCCRCCHGQAPRNHWPSILWRKSELGMLWESKCNELCFSTVSYYRKRASCRTVYLPKLRRQYAASSNARRRVSSHFTTNRTQFPAPVEIAGAQKGNDKHLLRFRFPNSVIWAGKLHHPSFRTAFSSQMAEKTISKWGEA